MKRLANIAKEEPHASYSAFTFGLKHKVEISDEDSTKHRTPPTAHRRHHQEGFHPSPLRWAKPYRFSEGYPGAAAKNGRHGNHRPMQNIRHGASELRTTNRPFDAAYSKLDQTRGNKRGRTEKNDIRNNED